MEAGPNGYLGLLTSSLSGLPILSPLHTVFYRLELWVRFQLIGISTTQLRERDSKSWNCNCPFLTLTSYDSIKYLRATPGWGIISVWSNDKPTTSNFSSSRKILWNTSASQRLAEVKVEKESVGSQFSEAGILAGATLTIQGWTIYRPHGSPSALGVDFEVITSWLLPVSTMPGLESLSPEDHPLAPLSLLFFPSLFFFSSLKISSCWKRKVTLFQVTLGETGLKY